MPLKPSTTNINEEPVTAEMPPTRPDFQVSDTDALAAESIAVIEQAKAIDEIAKRF